MRKTLVVIGLLALSQAAMAQAPAPAGGQGQSGANLPTCSASDAQRIRNGESPSTPCKPPADQSSSAGGSTAPAPSGGAAPPSR